MKNKTVLIKSVEFDNLNLSLEKEENYSKTRFTKYILKQGDKTILTSFHLNGANLYFDMILEEKLRQFKNKEQ